MDEPRRERRTPRLPWRPTKWSQELQDKLCEHLKTGLPIHAACDLCQIHRDTYYEWLSRAKEGDKPYVAFSDAVKKARAEAHSDWLDLLRDGARNKNVNWLPAAWFLERSFREDWARPAQKVEQTHAVVDPQELIKEMEIRENSNEGL